MSARTESYDPGSTTASEVAACLARFAGRRGTASAVRLLAFADRASESRRDAQPVPDARRRAAEADHPVAVPGTRYRADFGWPEHGVVGEFDGLVKYGRGRTAPDEDMAEVVWREKQREDRIRETGLTVVRWVWSEIGEGMVARLRTRLG